MNTSIDSFMRIGKGHTICEDYVIHGNDFVALSDGCSSSNDTDVGARILTHLSRHSNDLGTIAKDAFDIIDKLGMIYTCLDATLLKMYQMKENLIKVKMYGDGFLIIITKGGTVQYVEIEYSNSAPFYLSYLLNSKRMESYMNMDIKKTVTFSENYNVISKIQVDTYDPYKIILSTDNVKCIMVASDGLGTFGNTNGYFLPAKQIISQLVDFKNTNGEFLKRRCKRMIKSLEENGYYHYDDFSVGGMYFNE